MRKPKLILLVLFLAMPMTVFGASFTINEIRSVNDLQGAEFGLELGPLVLTTGVDFVYINTLAIDTSRMLFDEDIHAQAEGALLFPSVGVKILLGEKPTRLFVKGNVSKLIPIVNISAQVGSEDMITPEIQQLIQDNLKVFEYYGGKIGVGVEHRFDKHLGLVGEFGLRYQLAAIHLFPDANDIPTLNVGALVGTTYTTLGVGFFF
ncbi:MAG: hypothetical protein AB7C91_01460 [Sphaerochaeta sp.]|uniref:hypothetical protein n=1 Tax=Sphaerochaeta sp. TaxID=1972642 RepID=UPI003D0C3473